MCRYVTFCDLMAGHVQCHRSLIRDQGVAAPESDEYGSCKTQRSTVHRLILYEFDSELTGGDAIGFLQEVEFHRTGIAFCGSSFVDMHDGHYDFLQCRSTVDVPHAGSRFAQPQDGIGELCGETCVLFTG